jgi:hypothetical protein
MRIDVTAIIYVTLMIVLIVAVDFLFLKNLFWWRLVVNIGIVVVFAVFYMRVLHK